MASRVSIDYRPRDRSKGVGRPKERAADARAGPGAADLSPAVRVRPGAEGRDAGPLAGTGPSGVCRGILFLLKRSQNMT